MADAITIRLAVAADVPVIFSFIQALAAFEKLSHEVVASEALLREHLFGPRPVAEVLIGELSGAPVGFALFFSTFSTFVGRPGIWLEDLFVLPGSRRQGVGRALLSAVARLAAERGCGRLEWSVLDWNQNAIALYQRIGARAMSEWTVQRLSGDALRELADL